MFETLSNYWKFLKRPRLLTLSRDRKMLWKDILYLLILDFAFAGMVILVYNLLLKFNMIIKYEEFDIFQYGFAMAIVLGVVAAPVFEEIIFRWQLRKPKFSVWFVVISAALLLNSFTSNDYIKFFIFILFLIAGLVVFTLIDKLGRVKGILVFRGYYIFLFYYTAVIFGYVHLSNVKGLTVSDPSFVLYVISQVFGGLSIGYIRVKYGLMYGMLMHACFNGIVISLVWLLR